MNKWVVLILLILAAVAGGLSTMRESSDSPAPHSTSSPVVVSSPAETTETPEPQESSNQTPENSGQASTSGTTTRPKSSPFGKRPSWAKKPRNLGGKVKAVVFSDQANGDAKTKFPAGTQSIYLTVTPEGIKDEVELVAAYRATLDEKAEFSDPVQSSGPPRKRLFRLSPPKEGWRSGPYQVLLKAKKGKKSFTHVRFEILKKGETTKSRFPKPEYLDLLADVNSNDSTSVFDSSIKKIYLRVATYAIEPGTQVRSVWSAVDVDKLTPGELVATTELSAPGKEQDAIFNFLPPRGGFLVGSYQVDVYFEQVKVGSQAFFIKSKESNDSEK